MHMLRTLFLVAPLALGASACDDTILFGTPAPVTTPPRGEPLCEAGRACEDGSTCCGGGGVLRCVDGQLSAPAPCSSGESCDDDSGLCRCTLGARRCPEAGGSTEEVCLADGQTGLPGWASNDCGPGSCRGELGCVTCGSFSFGIYGCDAMNRVVQCGPNSTGDVVLDCPAEGMVACSLPAPGDRAAAFEALCVNACGTRGVALDGAPCESAVDVPCALLVCTEAGTLTPDHSGCLGAGSSCEQAEQCASCSCQDGACVGDQAAPCTDMCGR